MYDLLARYYDQLHASFQEDIPLILDLAQQSRGAVLELGCGTGRLLWPMARAGLQVVGLDNSPAMLDRARRLLANEPAEIQQHVALVLGDMLHLPPEVAERQYGLVVIPYNTLHHFRDHEVVSIFRQVAQVLGQHGMLFIDAMAPFALADQAGMDEPVLETRLRDETSGDLVEQWSAVRVDAAAQILHVQWQFRNTAVPGANEALEMAYHYYYPHQLELYLRQGGLRLVNLWGDYQRGAITEESERLLVLSGVAAAGTS